MQAVGPTSFRTCKCRSAKSLFNILYHFQSVLGSPPLSCSPQAPTARVIIRVTCLASYRRRFPVPALRRSRQQYLVRVQANCRLFRHLLAKYHLLSPVYQHRLPNRMHRAHHLLESRVCQHRRLRVPASCQVSHPVAFQMHPGL